MPGLCFNPARTMSRSTPNLSLERTRHRPTPFHFPFRDRSGGGFHCVPEIAPALSCHRRLLRLALREPPPLPVLLPGSERGRRTGRGGAFMVPMHARRRKGALQVLAISIVLAAATVLAEEIVTRSGRVLKDAEIVSIEGDRASIKHAGGTEL